MEKKAFDRLRNIHLFLFDLDGTVYLEDTPVPGAVDLVSALKREGRNCIFLTNNSSKSSGQYLEKLAGMGFPVIAENILTSGQVTGWYLQRKKPGASAYVVGTEALKKELAGYEIRLVSEDTRQVDYVVVGFDTELTYKKLRVAGEFLAAGASFIATNPDLVCPVGGGRYIPDCGSICVLLENATGKQPMFIGKPHSTMIEALGDRFSVVKNTTAVIGDRLYTDIALGCNAGIMSICTLTGETSRPMIRKAAYKPDLVVESVAELRSLLR